ncbi:hypothetical protein [Pseudodesulfovibrio piezophilus]|uniref:Uncharacterized protein n=1 Tax=Pseudodesulfovibrio piezophilus (strain DSM 21447 / JCM 15486 / C1TLV30) TaxID=1322246 RepID=M1WK30_PSEP2|nr:hypothetical protein [Pseudodesulfovibrio piezophilus]CCH48886.1 conserved exported protein of unknown function [Pseudodesulfovibrio piezophilus C1TLV30]
MHKTVFIFFFAIFLSCWGSLPNVLAADAETPDAPVNVAIATPGLGEVPVASTNLPVFLDQDLANKHANFSRFAKSKVSTLNRNHRMSRSRMQIIKQADGTYRARYHKIDSNSLVCKVRRSKSKTIPFVGVLSFKEEVFEAIADSPDACKKAEFSPVSIIPNRHIFSYKKGLWQ